MTFLSTTARAASTRKSGLRGEARRERCARTSRHRSRERAKARTQEDHVIILIWLPAEEIVNPELDIALAGILQLRQSEFAHLRRCIDSDYSGRGLRETDRPLTRAVGKLEDVSTRRKRIECRKHTIELKTPSRIALLAQIMEPLATEPLVVLASASPIVGELLGEKRIVVCHSATGYASGPRRCRHPHGASSATREA